MNRIKQFIPNLITSLNLFCGSISIIFLLKGEILSAMLLIGLAACFDLLDGLAARLLRATSEFGKQLDSLADVISFCLAPSVFIYHLFTLSFSVSSSEILLNHPGFAEMLSYSAFLIAVFGALRLARFNIAVSQDSHFVGMPVPAVALFVISIVWTVHSENPTQVKNIILNHWVILLCVLLFSILMVSRLRMISLKFSGYSVKRNIFSYFLLGGSLIILLIYKLNGFIFIMIYYVLLSLVLNVIENILKSKA